MTGRLRTDCPDAAGHTPSPKGYAAASEWAGDMTKTHDQKKCPGCGYWVIWVERGTAVTR